MIFRLKNFLFLYHVLENLIDFADFDGDGVINYAEFARVLTAEDVMRMKDTLAGNVDH